MFKILALSTQAAAAAVMLFTVTAGHARANVLVNGSFAQPGVNGSKYCGNGWSAAAGWSQFAVVPNSSLCTALETTFLPRIRINTNGGAWPSASMGNGIGQNFAKLRCAIATFWYNIVSGQVTGNLVRSDNNAFIDFNTVLVPVANNPLAWKHFTAIWDKGAEALFFETLKPTGITRPVNYQLMQADVEACVAAPPISDLSSFVTATPVAFSNDPAQPSATVRITNVSALNLSGPLHAFVEGLSGRAAADPDGDYIGTPYVTLVSGTLAPAQSKDITIYFDPDPAGVPYFHVKVASGAFRSQRGSIPTGR